jgi:hypothetical protein
LPIKFAQFLVDHHFFLANFKSLLMSLLKTRRQTRSSIDVDLSSNDNEQEPVSSMKSPIIRMNDIVPEMAPNRSAPIVDYLTSPSSLDSTTTTTTATSSSKSNQSSESRSSHRPWSDDEKQLLCKTIVRFPPGTPRRWEKIAETIGRHVSQVTDMAKQIQNTVGATNASIQDHHLSFSSSIAIDQNLITERDPSESMPDWSQADQHLLECALKNIPKDVSTVDRWEQIARCIPGKTPAECLARYRRIVQLVRAKKVA